MSATLKPLLDAILADPDDLAARRTYANALTQKGDPRGQLMMLQLDLEEMDEDDGEREEVVWEAERLLKHHRAGWLAELPMIRKARYRLGLIESVTANAQAFFDGQEALFAQHPVRGIKLNQLRKKHFPALAALLASRPLESLELSGNRLNGEAIEAIFADADLSQLRALDLLDDPIGVKGCRALAKLGFEALEELVLGGSGAAMVDEEPTFGDAALEALLGSESLPGLRTLELSFFLFGSEGAKHLASSPILAEVEILNLQSNPIKDEGVIALAGSPYLRELRALNLGYTQMASRGVDALAASPIVENLAVEEMGPYALILMGCQATRASRNALEARLGGPDSITW